MLQSKNGINMLQRWGWYGGAEFTMAFTTDHPNDMFCLSKWICPFLCISTIKNSSNCMPSCPNSWTSHPIYCQTYLSQLLNFWFLHASSENVQPVSKAAPQSKASNQTRWSSILTDSFSFSRQHLKKKGLSDDTVIIEPFTICARWRRGIFADKNKNNFSLRRTKQQKHL